MASRSQISDFKIPDFVLDGPASCANVDPELFFPQEVEVTKTKVVGKYVNISAARKICSDCPLKVSCLEYALRNHELGVWGGTTEGQRDSLRKARRIRTYRRPPTPESW